MLSAKFDICFVNQRLLCLLAVLLSGGALAAPAALEACKVCHDEDGSGVGKAFVPIIAGIPAAHIEEALYAYKDGARECVKVPAMCDTAAVLSDEDIAALADHYGSLERYSHATTFDEKLAMQGKEIHERLCARCHLAPDDPDVDDALGIPLHGQRADYLQYALEAYRNGIRENLLPEMAEKISQLDADDVRALVNYYVSY
jgi:sulfide dehydrogenase cytochrome subunit